MSSLVPLGDVANAISALSGIYLRPDFYARKRAALF